MPFVSDEQRKAAFARMKGRGGRNPTGNRAPRQPANAADDILMQILGNWIASGGDPFIPMPPGQGIPGTPGGPVTLTGGAIYGTAASDWAIHVAGTQTPSYGTTPGYGTTFDTDISINQFLPAQTFWGYLYLALQGIDPLTGQIQPGIGAPGTLHDPITLELVHQEIDAGYHYGDDTSLINRGTHAAFHGNVAPTILPMHPDAYSDRPWWAQ